MAAQGTQVLRGPVVRMGSNPGPDGLTLHGYRGLEASHAVISVYDDGGATITPVGSAQLRLAPHPQVNWRDLGVLTGPAHLTDGCAVYLGPPGRGVALQFHGCRPLGTWQSGELKSDGTSVHAARQVGAGNQKVFFGLGCLIMAAATAMMAILAFVFVGPLPVERLGPIEAGQAYYEFVRIDPDDPVNPRILEGMEQAFSLFVMEDNVEVSGLRLDEPERWDPVLFAHTARAVEMHLHSWATFRRFEAVRDDYATVLHAVREGGLPDVMAAIPYVESRYRLKVQSSACAKGPWQWMPESGPRFAEAGLDFEVSDCAFRDDPSFRYTPTDRTPPNQVYRNGDYISRDTSIENHDPRKCRIAVTEGCAVDSRTDLGSSTAAAVLALGEAYEDAEIRGSGAAVQMVIGSHYSGYDDAKLGVAKSYNILPAFRSWKEGRPRSEWPHFYGENLLCPTNVPEKPGDFCGSALTPGAQHYAYSTIAVHVLAACYYGLNYGDDPAFEAYVPLTRGDGYCAALSIPLAEEVRVRRWP